MRVVVTSIPQTGHIAPLLSLADAFAAQGDEVLFASGPDAEPAAAAHSLEFRAVAPAFGQWYETLVGRTRGVPGDGLAPARVEPYFLPRLFGEVGTALMVDGLLELCREVEPDLLVFETYSFAAPLVGARCGIPIVQHALGPLTDPAVLDLLADAVSPIWREFGLDVPPAGGVYDGTTLTICPPSLDPRAGGVPRTQALRPTPSARPVTDVPVLPFALPRPGEPVVYLTLGTFSNNPDQFRLLLGALAEEPVNVIATIGTDHDPAELAPLPSNAVVQQFVPQADLLPHCDAVVHHAGAGTTFGVLAHGLPAVALPQSADNFRIGELLATAGAAATLMPDAVSERAVVDALRAVMTDPRYRRGAHALATEIEAMPSAADTARSLRDRLPAR